MELSNKLFDFMQTLYSNDGHPILIDMYSSLYEAYLFFNLNKIIK